ncbi:hypothetical protein BCR42DRAFT_99243 [Absidia repens]|uniref:Yeast cell wall synthesis Kre9/Knh1-like N-terminal domain-containing protein n=1 Tax=Absidia repens TaxID=90262 RepID=A0A1X2I970_9FUNG|nr:hypothetical protein BCR42DRAFT_99243 [Absidia repens]
MRSIFFAIAALGASIVSADNIVSITSPLTGTVYTAGQPALISWIDATVSTIPAIVIAQGDPNALQPVSTIASNVDASAGSYTWNIPADFAPGTDYALELGTSPNISFTGLFTIQAGDGSSASSSASASSAVSSVASSSAVPSASSSAVVTSSSVAASSTVASSSASVASSSSSTSPSASTTPNAANKKTTALAGIMVGSVAVAMLLV